MCRNTQFVTLRCLAFCWVLGCAAAPAQAAPFQLVSMRAPSQAAPAGGSGDSYAPILSPDGRYVLFASSANNLLLNTNGNPIPAPIPPRLNVYLRDRANGTNLLVSANPTGAGGGNGDSIPTALSTDARYALFESSASDLIPGDTNNAVDVFVRDLVNGATMLVSASTNGAVGNGACRGSVMTPDGRYVAFVSEASNLVPNDTNNIADVFLRDLPGAVTTLVSAGAKATNSFALSVSSESPDITPDGRFVAFYSTATNLVPRVVTSGEVYVRDVLGGTTVLASTNARTILQSVVGTSSAVSYNHSISADGNFVAYEASAYPPTSSSARGIILRFNLQTGVTDLVNTNANAPTTVAYPDVKNLEMTPDGQFIAFVANTNGIQGTTTCVYRWDAQSGTTVLVSGGLSNAIPINSICDSPAMDSNGRFVAFLSSAANLVTNTLAGEYHLYLRDVQGSTTTLVDADTNLVGSPIPASTVPRLSTDGRFAAFECFDASLVADDRNHDYDVFVRDLAGNTTELISVADPALRSASANGPSAVSAPSLSADGQFVAYSSEADNLVPNDTNGLRDIFVRDSLGGNRLVSVSTNGAAADGPSSEPSLSADGRYVVFTSSADNLVAGDANRAQDVFVRDSQGGTTVLVSVNTSGVGPGNKASYSPAISLDGRYVLFRSKATNLGPGTSSGTENLFLRDLQLATNYTLTTGGVLASTMTPNGRYVGFSSGSYIYLWDLQSARIVYSSIADARDRIAISPDGQRIVCLGSLSLRTIDRSSNSNWLISSPVYAASRAGLRFTADGRFLAYQATPSPYTSQQVFLYDFETSSNVLISQSFSGVGGGNGDSDSPDISPDGRFVVYRSSATNLPAVPDTNGVPDLFLFDRVIGATTLLSASRYGGGPADNRSLAPVFSANGRTLLFETWASDLVTQDFNQGSDVVALSFLYGSITLGGAGQGPTLTWLARLGEGYHVQFKTTLSDGNWQDVTGVVTITGNQAQLTDLAPASGQRFYRITAF